MVEFLYIPVFFVTTVTTIQVLDELLLGSQQRCLQLPWRPGSSAWHRLAGGATPGLWWLSQTEIKQQKNGGIELANLWIMYDYYNDYVGFD